MPNSKTQTFYAEKFQKIMETELNYIIQSINGVDEKIIQCKPPYPSYWFISNMGYLLSVFGEMKILKPIMRRSKSSKKSSYSFYCYMANGKMKKVYLHKLIAEHFANDGFPESHDKRETHHIRSISEFTDNNVAECNRITNLQILPKPIHKRATYFSKPEDKIDKELEKLLETSGCKIQLNGTVDEPAIRDLVEQLLNTAAGIRYSKLANGGTKASKMTPEASSDIVNQYENLVIYIFPVSRTI